MAKHHIEATVNDDEVEFLCETEETLLDVLRDTLQLTGSKVDDAAMQKLDAAARAACQPIDDKRGTKEYRIKVAGVLARRAAQIALERARKG